MHLWGRYLLSGGKETAHLWDVRTQQEVRRFKLPFTFGQRVTFSPDDNRIAVSSANSEHGKHVLFDTHTAEPVLYFFGLSPEFVFDATATYTDQRFGSVRNADAIAETELGK